MTTPQFHVAGKVARSALGRSRRTSARRHRARQLLAGPALLGLAVLVGRRLRAVAAPPAPPAPASPARLVPLDDAALATKVEQALFSGGTPLGVSVEARAGVVTLRGRVADAEAATRFVLDAEAVDGVRAVQDELEPSPS